MQEIEQTNTSIIALINDTIKLAKKRSENLIVNFGGFNGSHFELEAYKKTANKDTGLIAVIVVLSGKWVNFDFLKNNNLKEILTEFFKPYEEYISFEILTREQFDIRITYKCQFIRVNETLPLPTDEDFEKFQPIIQKISEIDSLVQSAPLTNYLKKMKAGEKLSPLTYCLNDPETREFARYIFIKQSVDGDVLNVAFSTAALDDDNRILMKVFLQEANDFSRTNMRSNRPGARYTGNKLLDEMDTEETFKKNIQNSLALKEKFTGFFTISLNKTMHINDNYYKTAATTLFTMQTLEYHLKATKSWLQMKMRSDAQKWLQELKTH